MFKNYKLYSFMFCIDLLVYLTWGFGRYKRLLLGKGIRNPTPLFRPNVLKALVADTRVEPDNYYSLELLFEACGSH